jgi:hypothetical protein
MLRWRFLCNWRFAMPWTIHYSIDQEQRTLSVIDRHCALEQACQMLDSGVEVLLINGPVFKLLIGPAEIKHVRDRQRRRTVH